MLFTTVQQPTRDLPYEILGFCDGVTVRGMSMWRNFTSGFKAAFGGGNLQEIEDIILKLRHDAIQRCLDRARDMKADEVIGLRVDLSEVDMGQNQPGLIEVYVYGTAIKYDLAETKNLGRRSPSRSRRKK